jgi:hypothetical protein
MFSWFAPILLILTLGSAPEAEPVARAGTAAHTGPVPHDFHVTYSRLAVEDNMAVVRIRLFKDDLNQALSSRERRDVFVDTSPASDSLFQTYFNEQFVMSSNDEIMPGRIVGSGEEVVGNEPMWWYLFEFNASQIIDELDISQRILSEEFEDQKNIVQVQHFPSEKVYSLYCVEDAWEYTVSFTEE